MDTPTIDHAIPTPQGTLHLACQPVAQPRGDVLYVHGATFPSALSLFYRFDGRSWADALNAAGFNAWGLDFIGYGRSSRYAPDAPLPAGRVADALPQLLAALDRLARPVALLAHSWGTLVATAAAAHAPQLVRSLLLFGPIAPRQGVAPQTTESAEHRLITAWAQYRRFIDDVPRGHAPVLQDRHIQTWARDYLASDPHSSEREPPAVLTPAGPQIDVGELWCDRLAVPWAEVRQPTLIVRGRWDSACTDADVQMLRSRLGSHELHDVVIEGGTHLLHLEDRRVELHAAVNQFLDRQLPGS